ncbi:glycosyl transferase GT2 family [Methanobrevibacter ruminantium M1]|uniref:Glycosyl transferase GT2 family n=1 Tax=Methanobrevibacter ruminantium (strain ATCC 35063 / DSM 1093 / JCM 13430 / OCM 146 / M1) TaxID=634498 RepID=D3E314_METRM|nr:glycosyl transferase GT2 family [Methanobrevibacter ruminantium M1]
MLDADEFIISDNGQNPREIIKKINENYYYLIKWITYVPTNNDDYNIKFIPKRITHVRDESLEQYYKVIVPKKVVNDFNVRVEMGNHNLKFDNFNRNELVKKDLNLKIAHFPLRSIEQCISKVSIGWPNIIAINLYNLSWGFHWKMLFDKIKEENDISLDDLEFFAKNYALVSTSDDILIKNQPINLDFCDKIEIRYDFEYNYLRNILENYAYFAEEIVSFKRKLKSVPILDDRFILKLASDYDVIEKSGLFDVNWYCKRYSPPRNIHPIIHYLLTYRENMNDPAGFFSTEYYFKTHVDVANSGMNPFVHYIKYGKKENRKIASSKSENFGVQ